MKYPSSVRQYLKWLRDMSATFHKLCLAEFFDGYYRYLPQQAAELHQIADLFSRHWNGTI